MTDNPRATIGGNTPPLDDADRLAKTLDTEFAELNDAFAKLDLARFALPDKLETDDDSAKVTKWVADVKKTLSGAETKRKAKGAPYLAAQRTINDWFKELGEAAERQANLLEKTVGVYNKAKAERERAERLAREQEERRKADEARREEQRKREEADAAARAAELAAARIRAAKDAAGRAAAAAEMRDADTLAEKLRDEAEVEAETAAKAERKADNHERAAEGDLTKLSRISGEGATSSVSKRWVHEVVDWDALRATLGPLGPHLDNGILDTTLARIVRQQQAGGATPTFAVAGVEIRQDYNTNIRATRT